MSKSHTLMEIQEAFDSLRASIRDGRPVRGLAICRLFNDVDLTLSQAMVLAWLMEHKDSIYTIWQMCSELHIEEDRIAKIVDTLLDWRLLERKGGDIDVSDSWLFIILEYNASREYGIVASWSDFYTREKENQQAHFQDEGEDESDEDEETETPHIIETNPFWKGIKDIADEDALESMENFDPLETEEDADEPEEYDD